MKAIEKSLSSVMNVLQREGFEESFVVKEKGLVGLNSEKTYQPSEVKILNFYRFEGESDPADNSILYAIETKDGKRGLVTDAYGPYSDTKVTKFFSNVEDITKKTNRDEKL